MTMMIIMIIIAVTQLIFKLGPPDFAWKQIQIISNIYDDDDDDDEDDDDDDEDDDDDDDEDDDDEWQQGRERLLNPSIKIIGEGERE